MQNLPQDPMMLFSVINMKLRDYYRSLDELCEDMNIDKEELIQKLPTYWIPKRYIAVDELPLTGTGKPDRATARRWASLNCHLGNINQY